MLQPASINMVNSEIDDTASEIMMQHHDFRVWPALHEARVTPSSQPLGAAELGVVPPPASTLAHRLAVIHLVP